MFDPVHSTVTFIRHQSAMRDHSLNRRRRMKTLPNKIAAHPYKARIL